MGWRCVWVRKQLALYAGDDLSDTEKPSVESHLRGCAECRAHLDSLQRSREAMVQSHIRLIDAETSEFDRSFWPGLKGRLVERERRLGDRRAWLPATAILAAGVAMSVVLWNRPAELQPPAVVPRVAPVAWSTEDWDTADWAGRLSSPAVSWPEAALPRDWLVPAGPHFHLDRALPLRVSPGDL
jgi:anti-sigma factor RsiW